MITTSLVGDKRVKILQGDNYLNMVLRGYKYCPDLKVNLFAMLKPLKEGWNLNNYGTQLVLSKGGCSIIFDQTIRTPGGCLSGVRMVPNVETIDEQALAMIEEVHKAKPMSIEFLHGWLGHIGVEDLKATARYYNINWKEDTKPWVCFGCALAKGKKKLVPKKVKARAFELAHCLFIDISSTKAKSLGGNKFWLLVVDDCTDYCRHSS